MLEQSGTAVDVKVVASDPQLVEPLISPLSIREPMSVEIVAQSGRGLSNAINQGFGERNASHYYLSWLADDDILAPGALATSVNLLDRNRSVVATYGTIRYIDSVGDTKWTLNGGRWAPMWATLGKNYVPQPGSLFRASAIEEDLVLRESLTNSMDQDLFLRLRMKGKLQHVGREVAAFRIHDQSITVSKGEENPESIEVRRANARGALAKHEKLVEAAAAPIDRVLGILLKRTPAGSTPLLYGVPYTKFVSRK